MTVTPEMIEAFHKAYDASLEMQPRETSQAIYDGLAAALAAQTGSVGSQDHIDIVAFAIRAEFIKSVERSSGKAFPETGVDVPDFSIWERYARAALAAQAQSGGTPAPRGWPDPLESPQAEAIRSGKIDDVDIVALFDAMEREIRVHRGTFCAEAGLTHTTPPQTHMGGGDELSLTKTGLKIAMIKIAAYEARIAELEAAALPPQTNMVGEPTGYLVKRYDLNGVLLDTELSFTKPVIRSTSKTEFVPLFALTTEGQP